MSILISVFIIAIALLTIYVAYDSFYNYNDRAYGLAIATFCIGYIIIVCVSPDELFSSINWYFNCFGILVFPIYYASLFIFMIAWHYGWYSVKLLCAYSIGIIITPIAIGILYLVACLVIEFVENY